MNNKILFFYFNSFFLNIKYNTNEITDRTLNTDKQSPSKSFRELEKKIRLATLDIIL